MRERCLNAFTQITFTSPGPWPLSSCMARGAVWSAVNDPLSVSECDVQGLRRSESLPVGREGRGEAWAAVSSDLSVAYLIV